MKQKHFCTQIFHHFFINKCIKKFNPEIKFVFIVTRSQKKFFLFCLSLHLHFIISVITIFSVITTTLFLLACSQCYIFYVRSSKKLFSPLLHFLELSHHHHIIFFLIFCCIAPFTKIFSSLMHAEKGI
jgi:hypothetical protein